jgi:HD-GYP domain-containing protein (c-di-GMP phosphodiesterase class II)
VSELPVRGFLRALFHAGERIRLELPGHSSIGDALKALQEAAAVLTSARSTVVLTVADRTLFLGPKPLPHSTLEFNGMVSEMRDRRIDSVTLVPPIEHQDLADLAAVIGGASNDLPVGGTVLLNERPQESAGLVPGPTSDLHCTYAASLEALRALANGARLDTARVAATVEGFVGTPGPAALMLSTVRNQDEAAFYHSVNVCLLSLELGRVLGLGGQVLRHLATGALLHDLGRAMLGETAHRKKGSLSGEDWTRVRLHPQEGAQAILAGSGPGVESAAAIALEHHARIDGQGYPDLGGRSLHPLSRIVAVADSYEAITSPRAHRPARPPSEALRILAEGSGTAFDGDVVAAFLQLMGSHPPGSLLRMGSGEVILVTGFDAGGPMRGLLIRDSQGRAVDNPEPFDFLEGQVVGELLTEDVAIDTAALVAASAL